MRRAAILTVVLGSRIASADLANNEAIHDHVDTMLRGVDGATLDPHRRDALFADRLTLSLGTLVPIFGTYRLDQKVFGGVRPSGVVFDWILGGLAPASLAVIALEDDSLSSRTRSICAWTAVGLYASTRIAVLIVANLHVSEYNRYTRVRLGIAAAPEGKLLVAGVWW